MASVSEPHKIRVFFDTSVVIAGSFSSKGASYILMQLAGLTLLDGRFSTEVRVEAERNVLNKSPSALPALRILLKEALVEGASPSADDLHTYVPFADAKDVPILASAIAQKCDYLVTLNMRNFWPPQEDILVLTPGNLLKELRYRLSPPGKDEGQ